MGQPAARVGDLTTHGTPLGPGPGSLNVLIGGLPAWRAMGDTHACPAVNVSGADGVGRVLKGSLGVFINGMPAARMLDVVVETPGLAMGPMNPIAVGCPTVLIGDTMPSALPMAAGAAPPAATASVAAPAAAAPAAPPRPAPTLAPSARGVSQAPGPSTLRAAKRLKAPFVRKCGAP